MMKTLKVAAVLATLSILSARASEFKDSLFTQQWHLRNSGQMVLRSSGELTRDRLQGISGADINWLSPNEVKSKIIDDSNEIIVAVLDTGIDLHHPDLNGRLWYDRQRCKDGQAHDQENACHGFNFIEMNSKIADDVGHGTHVAGLIAANVNSLGVVGVAAPQIKIMPVKVVNNQTQDFVQNGRMITDIFADGIRYAVQNGADVINISLGWPKLVETPKIRIAITKAIESGVAIVAAAGNNGKDVPTFPCAYEGVICVGAMDNQGKITEYSNFGGKVDLVAPGENIISTYPGNLESRSLGIQGYEVKQGSSQAAPLVSAIVATLKLINPSVTLDEIMARLYQSARPVSDAAGVKLVRFGAVNMKDAIELKPSSFVAPDFKDLLTIYVAGDQSFEFELPVKSYVADESEIVVRAQILGSSAHLSSHKVVISELKKGSSQRLRFAGVVDDLNADANAQLAVTIERKSDGEIISKTQSLISFARTLESSPKSTFNIPRVDHRLVSYFSADRKVSRLSRVLDRFGLIDTPEFSYVDPRKVSDEKYVLSLLQFADDHYKSLDLELPALSQVLKVFVMDYNIDSKPDYMVYALSKDKKSLILSFFNHDGTPLYGDQSNWHWPLSTFEGLPQEGDREDFEYFKVNVPGLGEVLTPAMHKVWNLPEQDNTLHILDRLPESNVEHIYYLNPKVQAGKIEIEVRSLTGWNFVEKLQERFSLYADEVINYARPLKQTLAQALKGELTVPLSIGSEALKSHYLIHMNGTKHSLMPMSGASLVIEDNNRYPIVDLTNANVRTEHLLFALADRTTGRLTRINSAGALTRAQTLRRESWGDPFFNIIGSFKTESDYWHLLESRYKVIAHSEQGSSFELPLNRDSSFPGVQFSETLKTTSIDSETGKLPGVIIDSTLIYGERIYTMVAQEGGLTRPIKLSLETSKECIPSGSADFKGRSMMIYLCRDRFLNMRFEMVPLSLK